VFFKKFSFSQKQQLFSRSESDRVQSLIEFRVLVQRIESKSAKNERRTQAIYTGSFHNPEVVLSPLHFQGEFHYNVISNYKLLKHTSKRLPLLNHTRKRLLCSRTNPRDSFAQSHKKNNFESIPIKKGTMSANNVVILVLYMIHNAEMVVAETCADLVVVHFIHSTLSTLFSLW